MTCYKRIEWTFCASESVWILSRCAPHDSKQSKRCAKLHWLLIAFRLQNRVSFLSFYLLVLRAIFGPKLVFIAKLCYQPIWSLLSLLISWICQWQGKEWPPFCWSYPFCAAGYTYSSKSRPLSEGTHSTRRARIYSLWFLSVTHLACKLTFFCSLLPSFWVWASSYPC